MTLEERRERIRESKRRWREANPEYGRQYYAANSERLREYARQWREANPEQARERRRRYYAANPEKGREATRQWQEANPAKVRAIRLRRHHGMSADEWDGLWAAQQGLCYLCEEPMASGEAAVEHDHSCCPQNRSCRACRRGLAHQSCNQAAGFAGDDPDKLVRIAENLRAASKAAAGRMQHDHAQ